MKKHIFAFAIAVALLTSTITFVHASQEFTVPPLSEKTIALNLSQGQICRGSFSVTGGTGTGVDFSVSDPEGKQILSYNFTSQQNFSFSAIVGGIYVLSFNNEFCSCEGGKNVTLDYAVNQPAVSKVAASSTSSFPIAATALIIAAVAAAVVAAVILVRHRKAISSHTPKKPLIQEVE